MRISNTNTFSIFRFPKLIYKNHIAYLGTFALGDELIKYVLQFFNKVFSGYLHYITSDDASMIDENNNELPTDPLSDFDFLVMEILSTS